MNIWDWNYVAQILPQLLQASIKTLGITLVGFLIAIVLGLFLAIGRRSRQVVIAWPVTLLIEFIRSTPLLIQVYFLYYVLPNYGVNMSAMQAGILGIGLHYACYLAEVYRGGLDAVPRSQWEAAECLGLSKTQRMFKVILPQALRISTPPTVGFMVQIVKNTSIASLVIGFAELSYNAKILNNATFKPFLYFGAAAVLYFLICYPLSWLSLKLERKLTLAKN